MTSEIKRILLEHLGEMATVERAGSTATVGLREKRLAR